MKFNFLFILFISLYLKSLSQDTIVRFNILMPSNSAFELYKENVPISLTNNNYFEKFIYVDSLLQRVELFDTSGLLYDYTYENAITIYNYKNGILISISLFDKDRNKIEDAFFGYFKKEFSYDIKGRIIAEINYDKFEKPVKYFNSDAAAPYIVYKYFDSRCLKIDFDNQKNVVDSIICDCPVYNVKLK